MASAWYIKKNNQNVGPLSAQQLRELALAGKLQSDDLVRKGEDGEFAHASRIKNLFAADQATTRPTPPPPRLLASVVNPSSTRSACDATFGMGIPNILSIRKWNKQSRIVVSVVVCLLIFALAAFDRRSEKDNSITDRTEADTVSETTGSDQNPQSQTHLQLSQEKVFKPGQGVDYVTDLAVSEGGQYVVVNNRLFDRKNKQFVRFGEEDFEKVVLSPNRKLLGTTPSRKHNSDLSYQREVRVYSLDEEVPKVIDAFSYNGGPFNGINGGVTQVWWSPNSDLLLVNELDDQGIFLCPLQKPARRIDIPYPNDDAAKILSRSSGAVDTEDGRYITNRFLAFRTPGSVAVSPNGLFSITRTADGTHLMELGNRQRVRHFRISDPKHCSFATFSPDGSKLAVANRSSVELLNASTFERIRLFGDNHNIDNDDNYEWIKFAKFSPNNSHLFVQSRSDSFVTVIPCDGKSPIWELNGPLLVESYAYGSHYSRVGIAFSPDCSKLLFVAKKMLSVWDLRTKRRLLAFHGEGMTCADWYAEDRLLVGHSNGKIFDYSIEEVMGDTNFKEIAPQKPNSPRPNILHRGDMYFTLTDEEVQRGWKLSKPSPSGSITVAPPISKENYLQLRVTSPQFLMGKYVHPDRAVGHDTIAVYNILGGKPHKELFQMGRKADGITNWTRVTQVYAGEKPNSIVILTFRNLPDSHLTNRARDYLVSKQQRGLLED